MTDWMETLAGNSASSWLTAGVMVAVLIAAAAATRLVASRYLAVLAARTNTRLDDIILLLVRKTSLLIVAVLALFLAQKTLTVPERLSQMLRILAISSVFLQIGLWGNAVINFFLKETTQEAGREVNISARRAMALFGRLLLWLLVFALLLENLGVKLTPLLAGIGIGGVAVALALQNILGDLFCYVAIILDKPFVAGDFLVIDQHMGTVERIGLRTTRLRALSGELLVFANHDLVGSRVRNYRTLQERRVVLNFGVTYETPRDKLRRIPAMVKEIMTGLDRARLDRVHFARFGDSSLGFEVVYYILAGDYNIYMDVQQEFNLSLMDRFGKEGIDFAYPTQTLYLRRNL